MCTVNPGFCSCPWNSLRCHEQIFLKDICFHGWKNVKVFLPLRKWNKATEHQKRSSRSYHLPWWNKVTSWTTIFYNHKWIIPSHQIYPLLTYRQISMMWVVLGHTFLMFQFIGPLFISNRARVYSVSKDICFQLHSNHHKVFRAWNLKILIPEHYLILGLLGQGLLQCSNSNCVECSSFCGYVLFLKWTSGRILHIHSIGKEEI